MPTSTRFLAVTVGFLSITALLLSGCRNYQAGPGADLPFETIYIRPAKNDSFAPQAQALLSGEVRQVILRDTRVRLVMNEENADATLEVTITDYKRQPAARQREDTVQARDFDLDLVASISLRNNVDGVDYFTNRTVRERTNAYVENPYADSSALSTQNFLQAEYEAMPRLTRDLARKIADEVLSTW